MFKYSESTLSRSSLLRLFQSRGGPVQVIFFGGGGRRGIFWGVGCNLETFAGDVYPVKKISLKLISITKFNNRVLPPPTKKDPHPNHENLYASTSGKREKRRNKSSSESWKTYMRVHSAWSLSNECVVFNYAGQLGNFSSALHHSQRELEHNHHALIINGTFKLLA